MATALARRRHAGLARGRSKKVSWGWLAAGAALGGAAFVGYSMAVRPTAAGAMPAAAVGSNAVGGAGAGLMAGGLVGGLVKKSFSTALIGVVAGAAAFYAGLQMTPTPTP